MKGPKHILATIVISQFCCTSLWFAGNAVMSELVANFKLAESALGHLTSAVQFGFISGTLTFALLTVADRFSPSKVFFACAVIAAFFNLGMIWPGNSMQSLLLLRFFTGFMLAGIYPVGMKIATDYYNEGLGRSLGFLVGALVVGTAFPHLLKNLTQYFSWQSVVISTSSLSIFGGTIMLLMVPDGPYRKRSQSLDISAFFNVFKNRKFRSAAFGYFGHMWELYAFWAFVPIMLKTYNDLHGTSVNIPILSFLIIGLGGFACVIGGYLSYIAGTQRTAFTALLFSGICCLLSPLLFTVELPYLFVGFLFFWGLVVIADSPLFSTLVAQNAEAEIKGTALTIVNCIGFALTIFSIQLITLLYTTMDVTMIYLFLAIGPLFGLIAISRKVVS
ncbi:MAG: MFS transporter [Bacteroidota bacterium]